MSSAQTAILTVTVLGAAAFIIFFALTTRRTRASRMEIPADLLMQELIGEEPLRAVESVSQFMVSSIELKRLWFVERNRENLNVVYQFPAPYNDGTSYQWQADDDVHALMASGYDLLPIEAIKPIVREHTFNDLRRIGFTELLPVFHHGSLYGFYLLTIDGSKARDAARIAVRPFAQLLAAAYHEWHAVYADDQGVDSEAPEEGKLSEKSTRTVPPLSSPAMYKIALRRGPESVVPVLIDSLKQDLGVSRLSLLFDQNAPASSWLRRAEAEQQEIDRSDIPVDRILSALGRSGKMRIADLATADPTLASWSEEMKRKGFDWIVPFAISDEKQGALIGGNPSGVTELASERYARAAAEAAHIVEVAEYSRQLHEMSYTDALTGLANHRYFCRRLEEEITRSERYKRTLALIMFDVDDLKYMNDRHGHQAGDELLRTLTSRVRAQLRGIDLLARYGGDEFCVIIPEADRQMCLGFMERLQNNISQMSLLIPGKQEYFTASISQGAAIYPHDGKDSHTLVHNADMAMIKAKNSGRNSYLLYAES